MAFGLKEAIALAGKHTEQYAGRFFGSAEQLSPGIGVIFGNVAYPVFDPETSAYRIRRGPVLTLSHECDISQENDRPANSDVIFAPIIPFEEFFASLAGQSEERVRSYVGHLVSGNISQLFYMPPWDGHPNGSVVYFNRIGSTHVGQLTRPEATKLKALSSFGYMSLRERLSNHLLRDKAEPLPF